MAGCAVTRCGSADGSSRCLFGEVESLHDPAQLAGTEASPAGVVIRRRRVQEHHRAVEQRSDRRANSGLVPVPELEAASVGVAEALGEMQNQGKAAVPGLVRVALGRNVDLALDAVARLAQHAPVACRVGRQPVEAAHHREPGGEARAQQLVRHLNQARRDLAAVRHLQNSRPAGLLGHLARAGEVPSRLSERCRVEQLVDHQVGEWLGTGEAVPPVLGRLLQLLVPDHDRKPDLLPVI